MKKKRRDKKEKKSSLVEVKTENPLFDAKGSEGKQYSKATRSLEQKGYLIRHKGSPSSPTSYVQLTEDGLLISKTWKSYSDSISDSSVEDNEMDNFSISYNCCRNY